MMRWFYYIFALSPLSYINNYFMQYNMGPLKIDTNEVLVHLEHRNYIRSSSETHACYELSYIAQGKDISFHSNI